MVRFKVKQSESLKRPIEANGFFNPDISHCVEISDLCSTRPSKRLQLIRIYTNMVSSPDEIHT